MNKFLVSLVSAAMLALGIMPAAAFAQTATVNAGVNVTAGTDTFKVGAKATAKADLEAKAKERADQEIDRRITSLNQLSSRIGEAAKLSADQKSSLQASLAAQIKLMTDLKTKIDADDSTTTLKADVQSIAKAYRIYLLVLPQARIAAVADRVKTITDNMQTLAAKLKTRIDAMTGDKTALLATYADLEAKIADANTQAQAAVTATASLKPDNGDATIQAVNTAAIKDAKAKAEAASADLKAARQDITTLIQGVKGVHGGASATTTTNVETH